MNCWIISFKSTGEVWSSVVCSNLNRAIKILTEQHLMLRIHGTDEDMYQEWRNPNDTSQSATVVKKVLFD